MISTLRTPKRGEIYYIDKNPTYRPTYGSTQEPGRPAIIVSNDKNNIHALTYEIVYLTTQPKKDLPTHCTIRSSKYTSTALCEQITTVSNEQVRDFQGTCTEEEMRMVDACLAISLGLDLDYEEPEEEEEYEETEGVNYEGDTEGYDYEEDSDALGLTITRLESELEAAHLALAKAQKGEELMKELYNELLLKTIAK